MKAALLYEGAKELVVEDVEEPKIEPGEVLIRVKATGICHTDLHFIDGLLKPPRYPHVLGHEIAGVVEKYLPLTRSDEEYMRNLLKQHDGRVLVYFYVTCGRCYYCASGNENLCLNFKRIGFELWGGYAEYVKVPLRNLIPLPGNLDFNAAVLVDAGATTYRALGKLGLRAGRIVAIIGVGGLGGMALQLAKASGLKVVAFDVSDAKLKYAEELGADAALNASQMNVDDITRELEKKLGSGNVDGVIDTVGSNETLKLSFKLLKRAGKIVILGYGKDKHLQLPVMDLIYDELVVMGSRASSLNEVRDVVRLAERGLIRVNVTDEYALSDINTAFNDLRSGRILGRGVVKP